MDIFEMIKDLMPDGRVAANVPMRTLTTMRVGGPADCVLFAASVRDVQRAAALCAQRGLPLTVIGRGSNLIVRDGGIRGLVLVLGQAFSAIDAAGTRITAQAGAALSALSRAACEHGLSGLEFAEGIPGSVGGGITMNAGAYGGEISQVLSSVRALTQDGQIIQLKCAQLDMRYRHTKLMDLNAVALEAEFDLALADKAEISARMADFAARRREKQPLQYASAGSFFKRPEGYFAGKLIQDAGLKGARYGGAQISEMHAGFLINTGDATAQDVLALMARVQETVYRRFGVRLEPEVRILGEDG